MQIEEYRKIVNERCRFIERSKGERQEVLLSPSDVDHYRLLKKQEQLNYEKSKREERLYKAQYEQAVDHRSAPVEKVLNDVRAVRYAERMAPSLAKGLQDMLIRANGNGEFDELKSMTSARERKEFTKHIVELWKRMNRKQFESVADKPVVLRRTVARLAQNFRDEKILAQKIKAESEFALNNRNEREITQ
jgi:hypothetical protein